MNIINQMDYIQQKVKESYCEHMHVTPLAPGSYKIKDFNNPVTCDDCGKIIECEHEEVEHTELPYCTTCGNLVINEDSYYGYK